ncbi:hypothetical protein BDD12DRAFT_361097 [Trichophaea hybrida]|nr:hypothetical protein BDD12DRAFT_361097 [Trichophaea hybrida]
MQFTTFTKAREFQAFAALYSFRTALAPRSSFQLFPNVAKTSSPGILSAYKHQFPALHAPYPLPSPITSKPATPFHNPI